MPFCAAYSTVGESTKMSSTVDWRGEKLLLDQNTVEPKLNARAASITVLTGSGKQTCGELRGDTVFITSHSYSTCSVAAEAA